MSSAEKFYPECNALKFQHIIEGLSDLSLSILNDVLFGIQASLFCYRNVNTLLVRYIYIRRRSFLRIADCTVTVDCMFIDR